VVGGEGGEKTQKLYQPTRTLHLSDGTSPLPSPPLPSPPLPSGRGGEGRGPRGGDKQEEINRRRGSPGSLSIVYLVRGYRGDVY